VGVGVDGPPRVDVVAGPDLRPLHPVGQQPHPRRLLLPTCRWRLYCSYPSMGAMESESRTAGGAGWWADQRRVVERALSIRRSAASEGRGRGVFLPRLNGVVQGRRRSERKEKNVVVTAYKAGTRGSSRWPPPARGENETGTMGANAQNGGRSTVVTESGEVGEAGIGTFQRCLRSRVPVGRVRVPRCICNKPWHGELRCHFVSHQYWSNFFILIFLKNFFINRHLEFFYI
jgi:hypothetical protein